MSVKKVTLSVDEALLREARQIAHQRSTSLNAMIRRFLEELTERESRAAAARRRITALCEESRAEVGKPVWTREELHEH